MRKKALIVIGALLFCLSQIGVNFLIYKYKNKNTEIPRVQLRDIEENKKDKKSSFAIMLEQEDGSYTKTSSNSFDQPGYIYNSTKSGCVDDNGKVIENILNYNKNTKMMGVKTSKTAYCHIYFDKLKNLYEACGSNNMSTCESDGNFEIVGNLWQSGLENDGYRYIGAKPDNYICFGTSDTETCISNTDIYMYRIIGIFADSSGTKYMKLIKKEALEGTTYVWNSTNSDVDWGDSTIYSSLNQSIFLRNLKYIPGLWSNRIKSWTWREVNTLTYERSGTHYYYTNPKGVYQNEMIKQENSNIKCARNSDTDGTSARCAIGELKTKDAKVGLMYVSDYALSLGSESLSLTTGVGTNAAKIKSGWMHLSKNDSGISNTVEWTISRSGEYSSNNYFAWAIGSGDGVGGAGVNTKYLMRPVFYLNSNQVLKSGAGTLDNPFLLAD